ncbi:uncharacterized protein LOC129760550 [Uranotaenia lowii]|uniref:uncharacterized protein LOC129760550 n=1 Tax=Uranotaenia lowii TaxID=190385 RepID=UPI0024787326|nr:uncharacterized protein LOC129760550 [Uranotaenia lowii]
MLELVRTFMRNARRDENYYDALWICQYLSDILGLSTIRTYKPGEVPTHKAVPYGLILATGFQACIFVANWQLDIFKNNSSSFILRHGMRTILLIGPVLLIIITVKKIVFRKEAARLVVMIHEFDAELSEIGYDIDIRSQNRWYNRYMGVTFVSLPPLLIVAAYLTYLSTNGSWIPFLSIFFSVSFTNALIMTLIGHSISLLYAFKCRFRALHLYLSKLLPTEPVASNNFRSFHISKQRDCISDKIISIADLYHTLLLMVDRYNRHYGLQLLLNHVSATSFTIFSAFTMFRFLISHDQHSTYLGILNFIWSVYYSLFQFLNNILSSTVTAEAKMLGKITHKAINYSSDELICDKLLLLSDQVKQRIPLVSCKLFLFDAPFILTTLGSFATYLIILIQFDVAS